jgi:hypothetical protein
MKRKWLIYSGCAFLLLMIVMCTPASWIMLGRGETYPEYIFVVFGLPLAIAGLLFPALFSVYERRRSPHPFVGYSILTVTAAVQALCAVMIGYVLFSGLSLLVS